MAPGSPASSNSARRRAADRPPSLSAHTGKRAVVERMVEHLVSVRGHASDEVGVGFGPHAGDAEAGHDVFLLQPVQDVLGVAAVCASVERQRHCPSRGCQRCLRQLRSRGCENSHTWRCQGGTRSDCDHAGGNDCRLGRRHHHWFRSCRGRCLHNWLKRPRHGSIRERGLHTRDGGLARCERRRARSAATRGRRRPRHPWLTAARAAATARLAACCASPSSSEPFGSRRLPRWPSRA